MLINTFAVFRFFAVRSKVEWEDYIARSLRHDVYHSWAYHQLNSNGEALLFVYEEGPVFIALPLIKREIEGSTHFDLTSVYGYAGPVSNKEMSWLDSHNAHHFKKAFLQFMEMENCICVFSRLHPFIEQASLLDSIGGVYGNGKTIYMDLQRSLGEQILGYEKRLSRQIRKLREMNYTIREASGHLEIKEFTEMYRQNMDRLGASVSYYFDENYFNKLLDPLDFENKLILIYDGQIMICGALVLISKEIIRNHLSATAADYLSYSPSKLLTDEISRIGRQLNKKVFHLGGGVGGKEDSLFKFKSYFSDQQIEDRIWCYIHNQPLYDELVKQRGAGLNNGSTFFPLYRQPKTETISNIYSDEQ
jgi:hypothetical protein